MKAEDVGGGREGIRVREK